MPYTAASAAGAQASAIRRDTIQPTRVRSIDVIVFAFPDIESVHTPNRAPKWSGPLLLVKKLRGGSTELSFEDAEKFV